MPPAEASRPPRIVGVDVARALAALIMIQGHGYDAFVREADKASFAYAVTRFLGTFPLPAFLVLAGASLALRWHAAIERGHDLGEVRKRAMQRGAELIAIGYGVQFLFAAMDGWDGWNTLLRADVLQCIGLSLLVLAAIFPHRQSRDQALRDWSWRCVILAVATTLLCPVLSRLSGFDPFPWGYLLAPLVDVPGVTRMPLVPLVAWCAGGAVVLLAWLRATPRPVPPEGAKPITVGSTLLLAAGLAMIATALTHALMPTEGLTRRHPIVWLNVLDLLGRGCVVLALGSWLSGRLGPRTLDALVRLGQGSLYAYIAHLPFSYGAPARGIAGKLSMGEATVAVMLLMVVGYGAAGIQPWVRQWRRRWFEERLPKDIA